MAHILLMNAGSSSVKWKLFRMKTEELLARGEVERINLPQSKLTIKYAGKQDETIVDNLTYAAAAQLIIDKIQELGITTLDKISCVGHRVVAGGHEFEHAVRVTPERLEKIIAMSDYAPLHNPMEAKYIKLMQRVLPDVPQYAVFDSKFFLGMPEMNAIYSLPYRYTEKYHIRRYGEHGISHEYLMNRVATLLDRDVHDLRIITLHLGGGASITADRNGHAFDTSMGFTPLDGITMGTRSGDVDPEIVPFLMDKLGKSAREVLNLLNKESGMYGISGISSDMRDIMAQYETNERAKLAVDVFINRIVKFVGSYAVEMGGVDAIAFAGGIGENDAYVRQEVCRQLALLGIKLDATKNEQLNHGGEGLISTPDSAVQVLLVPTNEELFMVQQIKAEQQREQVASH